MNEVPLRELATFTSGGTPSRSRPDFFNGHIPWVTGADIAPTGGLSARSFVTQEAVAQSAATIVPPGTVLLVTRTSVGKVGIPTEPTSFSQDITAIHNDPSRLDRDYLVHYLRSREAYFASRARGATIKGVTREVVADLGLPLPPLDEQRRIAAMLDKLETLRIKRQQTRERLEALQQSIFLDMFGSRCSGGNRVTLKSMSVLITKGTTPTSVGLSYAPEGVPFLRVQNLQGGTVRFAEEDLFIDDKAHAALARSRIVPGDVLVSIAGTIGRSAIVPSDAPDMNCNQAVAIVRPADRARGRWLTAWLQSPDAMRQIRSSSVTGTISNLSLRQLGSLLVPEVDDVEVTTFTRRIRTVDALELAGQSNAQTLDELLEALHASAFSSRR